MIDALPEYILNVIARGDHVVLRVSNAKVVHEFPLSAEEAVKLADVLKRKADGRLLEIAERATLALLEAEEPTRRQIATIFNTL